MWLRNARELWISVVWNGVVYVTGISLDCSVTCNWTHYTLCTQKAFIVIILLQLVHTVWLKIRTIRNEYMVILLTDSLHLSSLSSSSPAHTPKEEYIIGKSEDSGELVGNHTEQPQSLGRMCPLAWSYITYFSILFLYFVCFLWRGCSEILSHRAVSWPRACWERGKQHMGGTAMCPTGTAGEGDAGDQENGVKASGELLFVHIYKWLFLQNQAFHNNSFQMFVHSQKKKVQKPSLGLYLFKRENFCPF